MPQNRENEGKIHDNQMSIVQLLVSHGADLKISDHTGTGLYPDHTGTGLYLDHTGTGLYPDHTGTGLYPDHTGTGLYQTTQALGYIHQYRYWVISISTGTRTAE